MKHITIRLIIAICTFFIGIIVAATWLFNPVPNVPEILPIQVKIDTQSPTVRENTPDSTVYSVNFCELLRNPKNYDGKIVRTRASYLRGIDFSSLSYSKCQGRVSPSCNSKNAPCEEIWSRIGVGENEVDVIGRFNADVVDPSSTQNDYRVNLLEILEVKSAKPVKFRR